MKSSIGYALVMAISVGVYAVSLTYLQNARYTAAAPELLVSVPRFAQILFFGGDRFLAANIGGFRVLVAETAKMKDADYAVQAKLQRDIAWLNPAHEDNYYIAANILPWGGQVKAAEEVLRRAGAARPYDFLPYFHIGFIHFHFYRDPAEGAGWLLRAAERASDQQDQWGLQAVAAKWIERGYETEAAASLVDAMAASAPAGGMRSYLQMRAERLRALAGLRKAADAFKVRFGHPPEKLEDLVREGFLQKMPEDRIGSGFVMGPAGEPAFAGR